MCQKEKKIEERDNTGARKVMKVGDRKERERDWL